MEGLPQRTKTSGVNRVVGFDPDMYPKREGDILDYFERKFNGNESDSREKEKTNEQLELFSRLNHEMSLFLKQYGIQAIDIPPNNIHILDKTKFTEGELEKIQKQFGTETGFHSSLKQGVGIMKDYDRSKLSFFQTLVHEMLHLQEFRSYQKSSKESGGIWFKRESVFNLFATAAIRGDLLPVARLIEKTFGVGSFRRLGEMTARESSPKC